MPEPGVSIQLIVFGERARADIAGVLNDVAAAGYHAIEAGNLFATYGAEETRRLLADTKLSISGAHFGYGEYADLEKLGAHIAYARAASVRNLMCSGVADAKTAEGYRQSATVFNEVGRRLADEGLAFHYHNHAWEFDDLGGVNGMQILADETDPGLVNFNLDVFWLYYAGLDPAKFILDHAERAGYFHFKDGIKETGADGKVHPKFLELGRGEVDLKGAMDAARRVDAQWIVAEQDSTTLPHYESIHISREFMRNQLGLA